MNSKITSTSMSWYREPWPWILMAGPFVVVIAGFFTAYLAVISNDGLVSDDYYKQGLAINQQTERDQRAISLGLVAEVLPSAESKSIRVFLQGERGFTPPAELSLRLIHPTRAGVDQVIALRSEGTGFYSGKFLVPPTGRWHVALEDEKHEWRMLGNWLVENQPTLRLQSIANAAGESSVVRSNNTGR
jgi:uncharacterized protein